MVRIKFQMRIFKLFFFFLFLLFAGPVSAQIAKWIHPKSGNIYQINFETKEFFENKDGAQWNKLADLNFQDIKSYDCTNPLLLGHIC